MPASPSNTFSHRDETRNPHAWRIRHAAALALVEVYHQSRWENVAVIAARTLQERRRQEAQPELVRLFGGVEWVTARGARGAESDANGNATTFEPSLSVSAQPGSTTSIPVLEPQPIPTSANSPTPFPTLSLAPRSHRPRRLSHLFKYISFALAERYAETQSRYLYLRKYIKSASKLEAAVRGDGTPAGGKKKNNVGKTGGLTGKKSTRQKGKEGAGGADGGDDIDLEGLLDRSDLIETTRQLENNRPRCYHEKWKETTPIEESVAKVQKQFPPRHVAAVAAVKGLPIPGVVGGADTHAGKQGGGGLDGDGEVLVGVGFGKGVEKGQLKPSALGEKQYENGLDPGGSRPGSVRKPARGTVNRRKLFNATKPQ
ncbi:hypothetical protein HK102_003169 [Quaeritorhiza haematococci]|nr:hypothetical protein HK102_003169 [Quaeritorhiza haematococci]